MSPDRKAKQNQYLKNYRSKMTPDQKAKRMETQKAYRLRKKPIELATPEFHDIASEGPVYICFCCNQLWYRRSVLNAKKAKRSESCYP